MTLSKNLESAFQILELDLKDPTDAPGFIVMKPAPEQSPDHFVDW